MRSIATILLRKYLFAFRFRGVARIGSDLKCHGPVVLLGREKICFGDRVSIAGFPHIWGHGGVAIGNDVLIASHVVITSVSHDSKAEKFSHRNCLSPVDIGSNVWIGSHAFINAGVVVGSNSIIAAGAIVLSDVPPGCCGRNSCQGFEAS
jgi:acetyltransferase-like isoleucine patch superfamily enzyme